MLFNSFEYLLFLPLAVVVYYLLRPSFRWVWLLALSYFFYMYWRPEYGLLLLAATSIVYWAALKMPGATEKWRKIYLWISVLSNVGMLAAFKYLGFINEAVRDVFTVFDFSLSSSSLNLLLPVGISFYTFQALSYAIDVYRKRREPERHFGIFALYVSFFPQLVAGPIERSTRLLPQFREVKRFSWQRMADGGRLIMWGLFKKIILADTLGGYVNRVFYEPELHTALVLVFAVAAFGLQLYLDFSGYTDIAIGSALLMGYTLMPNFERPFRARTIREFWNRWHISLTSWMFDYVYRPLGKKLRWNWHLNILILFLIIGIWHGAGWGFVVFGLLNGFYYLLSYYTLDLLADKVIGQKGIKAYLIGRLGNTITLLLLGISAIFFRSGTLEKGWFVFTRIFTEFSFSATGFTMKSLDIVVLLTALPVFFFVQNQPNFESRSPFHSVRWPLVRWGLYYFVLLYLVLFGQRGPEEFIYFQF